MTSREEKYDGNDNETPLMTRVQVNHTQLLRERTNEILSDDSTFSENRTLGNGAENNGNVFNYAAFPSASYENGNDDTSYSYDVEQNRKTKVQRNFQQNSKSSSFNAWMPFSVSDSSRRHRATQKHIQSASDLVFRSTNSTRRAMRELEQRRYEATQRKKATSLSFALILLACGIYYVSKSNYDLGMTLQNKNVDEKFDLQALPALAQIGNTTIGSSPDQDSSLNNLNDLNDEQSPQDEISDVEINNEPPPEEEVIEPGKEFLQPYRYFADLTTSSRKSDSNFFFHIPRSGGQTIKDIVGKCLQKTLASEVGVRDGHGQDAKLQVVDFNGAKYVNVDTTSIDGLHRSAAMGLASSGLSDLIASSYFGEVGMLFDLHHKGRAFILLRDPMVRAVSMYYYKTQGDVPIIDSSVTLEDYAQGNGIENNWVTRFLTGRMEGEIKKEDLEQAKEILSRKFLIGFLDDGEETVYRLMKYFGFSFAEDETQKMEQEDCIKELLKEGTNQNSVRYEMPKRGSQAAALIKWQTQFDIKLFDYGKELFDAQTKMYGSKERKKELKKRKKDGH